MKQLAASRAIEPAHVVRFFQSADDLVESVTDFAATGLELGDAALLAVSRSHAMRIRRELSQRGYAEGLADLTFFDADAISDEVAASKGRPEKVFARLLAPELAAAAERSRSGQVRAYGEIVDVLWVRGLESEALSLERRWHQACQERPLRLLCGYRLPLMACRCLDIAETHDAVLPAPAPRAAAEKARAALQRLLGPQADMLRALISQHRQLSRLPFEQAALIWMGRHMPASAARLRRALEV